MNDNRVAAIAAAYCATLAEWLSPEQRAAIASGEAWPDDYCDGNLAMEAAFDRLAVPVWDDAGDHMRDDAIGLWNAAYDVAAARCFAA